MYSIKSGGKIALLHAKEQKWTPLSQYTRKQTKNGLKT